MATHSFNTLLKMQSAAGPPIVYTSVGCVHDISGPEISVTSTDTSCLTTEWKTFMAGLIDAGEVTFTIDYLEVTYEALLAQLATRETISWELSIPLPTNSASYDVFTFDAFITRLGLTIPFDDRIVVPVTLKVTGEITDPA